MLIAFILKHTQRINKRIGEKLNDQTNTKCVGGAFSPSPN